MAVDGTAIRPDAAIVTNEEREAIKFFSELLKAEGKEFPVDAVVELF